MDVYGLDLSDDDVVVTVDKQVRKYKDFKALLDAEIAHGSAKRWLGSGLEVEFLRTTGGGWKKGKIRLRFEFLSDEPDPNSLDALREELRQADKFPPVD